MSSSSAPTATGPAHRGSTRSFGHWPARCAPPEASTPSGATSTRGTPRSSRRTDGQRWCSSSTRPTRASTTSSRRCSARTHCPDSIASVTGGGTLDHDFNELSQHDLESGELGVGLPAALVILILVFGAVVAGLVPLADGDRVDRRRARTRARWSRRHSRSRSSSSTCSPAWAWRSGSTTRCSSSRASARSGQRPGRARRDRRLRRDRQPCGAVQRHDLRDRLARPAARAVERDHEPRRRRDRVGIVSVLAALTLLPAVLGLLGDRVNRLRVPGSAGTSASLGAGGTLLGRHRAGGDQAAGALPRRVRRAADRRGGPGPRPEPGRERRQHAARPARVKQGFEALESEFPQASASPALIAVAATSARRRAGARSAGCDGTGARSRPSGRSDVRSRRRDLAAIGVAVGGDKSGGAGARRRRDLRSVVIPRAFRRHRRARPRRRRHGRQRRLHQRR